MVFVAFCAARIATSPAAAMTSTRALTNSAAYSENQIGVRRKCAVIDREVLAFNKAMPPQFIEKGSA